ncbi:16S rRNA (guanine(966)-N(2))-methyltransferase RsmD [Luteimonas sp. YGD11-2]|uniref:16S rRNA (guanine(966)-N(2))-methyltransferase RsmD n=1 Tax=Luteimonas sp. YGD11-2 TaxID=2508168 RepID=UPI00100BAADE|nr:16S rRNA (guanine(966)-N(2))-methyltransferase RsmD [Luteimonas sp. YGD11-2]
MARRNSPGTGASRLARGPGMGSVRIVGGRWRGSRLPVPDAPGLRPTSDRARETLFNWLQPWLPGARVLDLFAGSGALGFEAVSRGAAQAVLVERDAALADALEASVRRLDAADSVQVVRADALELLRAPLLGRFDGVFCDPPFEGGLWATALQRLAPWLADDAWLYVESPAAAPVQPDGDWHLHREGGTRDARHALYRRGAG